MAYVGRGVDAISNVEKLTNITFDGSTTYNLVKDGVAFTPAGKNNILISINGVIQQGNFTVAGATIVFDFSPTSDDTCNFIMHYGTGVLNTPADDTVKTATVQDGAVTTAKLGADSVNATKIADDSISDEHLDITAITGQTAITSLADTDKFLVSDASDSGNLKYVEKQYLPSGIFNLITSFSPSSEGSNITVDNCFTSTYDKYFITLEQLRNGNDQARVDMYLRVGGGSGSDAGSNHGGAYLGYRYDNQYMSGSTVNSLQGTIAGNVQNDTFYHGYVWVFYPTTTSVNTTFQGQMTFREGSTSYAGFTNFGYIDLGTQAHTGFAIQNNSGNFNTTATRFNVYGITNGA